MELEWKLFADLKEYAGSGRVTVEVDEGATVGDALTALVERTGLGERVLDEDGRVQSHVNVLKNGTNVETSGAGLEEGVEERDELALFPPVSGGACSLIRGAGAR